MRPAKTQISLGIRPVWSEFSLCAQWVAKDPSFFHADSEDSDQTGRMPRLIWVFAGRTLIFLVLSFRGSVMANELPSIKMCTVIRIPPQRKKLLQTNCQLHGQTLQIADSSKYLGFIISDDLTRGRYIQQISGNGNRTLGFLRRNFKDCSIPVSSSGPASLHRMGPG